MDYDKYKNKMEFPSGLAKPFLSPAKKFCEEAVAIYAKELKAYNKALPEWREAREKYRNEDHRLFCEFKKDALLEVGLATIDIDNNVKLHPKAEKAFNMAWEDGHSSGYENVMCHLESLSDLLVGE